MKQGINVEKLVRLQASNEMRLFQLRGISDRIINESRSADEKFWEAVDGATSAFSRGSAIENVVAALEAEVIAMEKSREFKATAISAARRRVETAMQSAGHRARMQALSNERERIEAEQRVQGQLLFNLNAFAEVRQ